MTCKAFKSLPCHTSYHKPKRAIHNPASHPGFILAPPQLLLVHLVARRLSYPIVAAVAEPAAVSGACRRAVTDVASPVVDPYLADLAPALP